MKKFSLVLFLVLISGVLFAQEVPAPTDSPQYVEMKITDIATVINLLSGGKVSMVNLPPDFVISQEILATFNDLTDEWKLDNPTKLFKGSIIFRDQVNKPFTFIVFFEDISQ